MIGRGSRCRRFGHRWSEPYLTRDGHGGTYPVVRCTRCGEVKKVARQPGRDREREEPVMSKSTETESPAPKTSETGFVADPNPAVAELQTCLRAVVFSALPAKVCRRAELVEELIRLEAGILSARSAAADYADAILTLAGDAALAATGYVPGLLGGGDTDG